MSTSVQVRDRASIYMRDRASAFYAPQQLGRTRYLTPEGYLVCEGVPIARTGEQAYLERELNPTSEITIRGNSDGIVIVKREPEDVFRPETIASFEGKPITVEHPTEFVTPDTFKLHSVGHMQHVRRGEGIEDDLLLADFVITDPEAIAYVNRALPEVSAGYTADYEQQEPGVAFQRNILGNHSALVERGRAGPRVSIRDSIPTGDVPMKLKDLLRIFMPNLATADTAAIQAALDADVPGAPAASVQTTDAAVLTELKALNSRLDTMDAQIKDLAKRTKDSEEEEETEEEKKAREAAEAKKAEDDAMEEIEQKDTILEAEGTGAPVNLGSVYTGDSASGNKPDAYTEIVSRAEILAPGISIPTKDSLKGSKGVALATFMRTALTKCETTDAGKEALNTFLGGRKVNDLKGHALLGVFNGTAKLVSARNNRSSVAIASVRTGDFSKPSDIASINEQNRKFWANGGK